MWHVSSRSGVATLRTAIHLLLTYLQMIGATIAAVCARRAGDAASRPALSSKCEQRHVDSGRRKLEPDLQNILRFIVRLSYVYRKIDSR